MIVGVGDIAAEAAVRRRVRRPQHATAEARETVEQWLHIGLRDDIVREREGAGAARLASHIVFECERSTMCPASGRSSGRK